MSLLVNVFNIMNIGSILKEGLDKKASDIIVSSESLPSLKIDGDIVYLNNYEVYSSDLLKKELFKIMTEYQRKFFTDNLELDFSIDLKGYSRFRVNIFNQRKGIGAAFRPIPSNIPEFLDLGLPEEVKAFAGKRGGLVLVTGSVGSGKSTTLASLINEINKNSKKHIITIEDPIEYIFDNNNSLIEQREVGTDTLSFDNGLKYSLRQAPDVIMVGEMRDLETFRLALRAAETGNLVFATLHTSGAARTISRIIDMFPGDEKDKIKQQLSDSLLGVVWQALIKRKSGNGRVPAVEVLVNTKGISNLIRKGLVHQVDSFIETGKAEGMIPMKESLTGLVEKGVISEKNYNYYLSTS